MKYQKKIAFLGGDLRQYTAAGELAAKGFDVELWGLDCSAREEKVQWSLAAKAPMPVSARTRWAG